MPLLRPPVEENLQKLEAETGDDPDRYKQVLSIRHYLSSVVGDCEEQWLNRQNRVTNHATLLSRISRWCKVHKETACFVTFNYDTFIEQAFADTLGIAMREMSDYVSHGTYKVIKLHGSVTWFHAVDTPIIADLQRRNADEIGRELIARAQELKPAAGFLVGPRTTIGKLGDDGPAVIPAIAMPVREKRKFECPDEHVEALKSCLPYVTKLILIGWKGAEQHFLELLRASLPASVSAIVVGQDQADAEKIVEWMGSQRIPGSFEASRVKGFSKFIEEVDAFLDR